MTKDSFQYKVADLLGYVNEFEGHFEIADEETLLSVIRELKEKSTRFDDLQREYEEYW